MSAENFSAGSRIDFEIDDKTVRKHGSHDGEFDVEYDRIVPKAVEEVSTDD